MKYDNAKLKQMLAAEYVIGTLAGAARRRFRRLLAEDRGLRDEVQYWTQRFDELGIFEPVPPRDTVWAEIERRIREQRGTGAPLMTQRRPSGLNFWRAWAGLATAASVALAMVLARHPQPIPPPAPPDRVEVWVQAQAYVAALRLPREDAQWTVSVLPDTRAVRVIANGPARLGEDQDYELWWLGDEGVTSLGLLPRNGAWQVALPPQVRVSANGRLAVSLEPAGGSPAGSGPSGPVLLATPLVPSV